MKQKNETNKITHLGQRMSLSALRVSDPWNQPCQKYNEKSGGNILQLICKDRNE